ncbi:hypothetical protein KP79_PYT22045 [Mizuhopecten yessoensis]|uniref:C2H2-type domain-containing protein n=1 Tax=Mizuhopecten yessoensis TaxID=6573 RepID=A0A210PYS1_MIZYE|nr:hypothetical protein KP79_PYT22045 [Mizuhopecten yessoensis]
MLDKSHERAILFRMLFFCCCFFNRKRKLSNQMEITIDTDLGELYQFQEVHVREVFPRTGMVCQVPACDGTKYTKLGKYLDHWSRYHRPTVQLYQCERCRKKFSNKLKARKHGSQHQPKAEVCTLVQTNREYRNPGDILPPRCASLIEREEPKEEKKKTAQEKRKISPPQPRPEHDLEELETYSVTKPIWT